jgi:DNA repair protein RecO (recombination protein O)
VLIETEAVVLHKRPFRNTSLLLDLFTLEHGVGRFVARIGAKTRQNFEVFNRLWLSYKFREGLCTLNKSEVLSSLFLRERRLISGLYINELLLKLLPAGHSYPLLFAHYQKLLTALNEPDHCLETLLRRFELILLKEIGYELNFRQELNTGNKIQPQCVYQLLANQGFCRLQERELSNSSRSLIIEGKILLEIAAVDFSSLETRRAAKQLFRVLFQSLLEGKPILSREIF